jgi:hypothetical protein
MFHNVAEWTHIPHQSGDETTPGRIATVFFTPEPSFNTLIDKEPGWGFNTNYGRWEGFEEF